MAAPITFHTIKTEPYALADNNDYNKEAFATTVIKQEPPEILDGDGAMYPSSSNQAVDEFPVPVSLYPHMNTTTSPLSSKNLDHNMVSETLPKGKKFRCNFCLYRSADMSVLVQHMRIHTGEKPYMCEMCEYRCAQLSDMTVHKRTHVKEKRYSCSHCSYRCKALYNIQEHERTHTGDKPYQCSYCSYTASQKGSIARHERIHTGEKPYTCSLCSYDAVTKGQVILHERTHKPLKRSICSYAASNKRKITIHEQTHTGEQPYKFAVYPRSITQKQEPSDFEGDPSIAYTTRKTEAATDSAHLDDAKQAESGSRFCKIETDPEKQECVSDPCC